MCKTLKGVNDNNNNNWDHANWWQYTKVLHPEYDRDRLFVSREKKERRSIQGLEDYFKKSQEKWIIAANWSSGNINTDR